MKFDISQKVFNTEIKHEYKIKNYMSCGRPKFLINVAELRKLLQEKYKYTFNDNDEDDDSDDDEKKKYDYGIIKQDLSVKMSTYDQIKHYEKLLKDLRTKHMEELETEFSKNTKKHITKVTKYDDLAEKKFNEIADKILNGKQLDYYTSKQSDDLDISELPTINFSNI
jgi:hypothetical protein